MTQEELERLEKGKQMRDDIEAHKRMISLMEEAINLSDDVRSAMIVINKETEAPMPPSVAVEIMAKARGMIEDEYYKLTQDFEKL